MTAINDETFAQDYITAWSTTDDATRKELVTKLYAYGAAFYSNESNDGSVEFHGVEEINANITHVNVRLVQDKGLITQGNGFAANHDVLKVSWKMVTSDGNVVMTGMDILVRDVSGKIVQDYIFIG